MYKLALLLLSCYLITIVTTSTHNGSKISGKNASRIIWVLNLNDRLEFNKLKTVNKAEKKIFISLIAPAIRRFKEQNKVNNDSIADVTVVSSSTKNETGSIKKIKGDIMKILNKFIITYSADINDGISQNDIKTLKLTLFFFGPYTSLIVKVGKQNLHYFIDPPSSLPRWFYQTHKKIVRKGCSLYVDIPKEIKYEFYEKFLHLLYLFLSYPV